MNDLQPAVELPYRVRADIFSEVERGFLSKLIEHTADEYFIIPKLALSELFRVNKPNENIQFISKLGGKSIDFVLFSQETFSPVAAIELENPKESEHAVGSKFIDEICASVGFPVFHIIESERYGGIDWFAMFTTIENSAGKINQVVTDSDYSPVCPHCGITMVLRFDQDGPISGQKYYGCLNYPECEEKITVEIRG